MVLYVLTVKGRPKHVVYTTNSACESIVFTPVYTSTPPQSQYCNHYRLHAACISKGRHLTGWNEAFPFYVTFQLFTLPFDLHR